STSCLGLYVEGVRDGARFLQVASEVTLKKPIVVMKVGGGEATSRASLSHTGALAGSDLVFSAVCRKSGMIRVNDWDEMFSMLLALSDMKRPTGDGLGIISIGGGIGIEIIQSSEQAGLHAPKFSQSTIKQLQKVLPKTGSISENPIDIGMVPREDF